MLKDVGRQSAQARAVAVYLELHGSLSNNTATYGGLPEVGNIPRLAARIAELREVGYELRAEATADHLPQSP
jgi:hypothetical protein